MRAINLNQFNRALVSLLFIATLMGCEAKGEEAAAPVPPPPQVDVAMVQAEKVVVWGSFTGRITAPEAVDLMPRVSGYIDKINFVEGDMVEEGDLLFQIDPRQYQARAQLAQAELARAQSQFALASSESERAKMLWESRAISREEFDQRTAATLSAQAAVNAATARLHSAQLELEYTRITAPVSGRIGRAEITRGNLATANTTVLANIVSVDPLYVYFESDQSTAQINLSAANTKADTEKDTATSTAKSNLSNTFDGRLDVPVRVLLGSDESQYIPGQLDFISNQYNSRTGTLQYRAVIPNPNGYLKPGQFARVEMPITTTENAVLVDQKAVLTDQDRRYVYVLNESDKIAQRFVDVGRRFHGLLLIDDGLQHGDRVVVNGLQKIAFPGMQVAPQVVEMRPDRAQPILADNTRS